MSETMTRTRRGAVTGPVARTEVKDQLASGAKLIDPSIFAQLPRYTEAKRGHTRKFFDRMFSTQPGKLDAPTEAADPLILAEAMKVIETVSSIADVVARLTELEVLDDDGVQADASAAANRARAAVWDSSGVPPERRPMRSGVLGAEVSTNKKRFQEERLEERQDKHVQSRKRREALVTKERAKKSGLGKAAGKPAYEKPGSLEESVGTGKSITGLVETISGLGSPAGSGLEQVAKRFVGEGHTWTDKTGQTWDFHKNSEHLGGLVGNSGGLLSGAAGTTTGVLDLVQAIDKVRQGGGERRQGLSDLASAGNKTLQGMGSASKSGVLVSKTVESLHGHSAYAKHLGGVADSLGGALSILQAVNHVKEAAMQGRSSHGLSSSLTEGRSQNTARDLSTKGMSTTHTFKAAISSGQAVGSTVSSIGGFLAATPAGPILKVIGTVISTTASSVETVRDSYVGGKVVEKEFTAQYLDDSEDAASYVLMYGADHAAEILIRNAKGGDKPAIAALKSAYGIDEKDLQKSDKALRKLIKAALRQSDARNIGTKISEGLGEVSRYFSTGGLGDIQSHRMSIAWRTAQAKNLMGYGGRTRTEKSVRAKAFFRNARQVDDERKAMIEVIRMQLEQDPHKYAPQLLARIQTLLQSQALHKRDKDLQATALNGPQISGPTFDTDLYAKYHRPGG